MHCLVYALLCVGLAHALPESKRTGDDNTAALEVLIQRQAATIEVLEARLDAQHNTVQSLQNTIDSILANVQNLTQQAASIQAKQGHRAAFHVDFGQRPYHRLDVSQTAPVIFNRVQVNIGDSYNNDTGIFTAPYPGIYSFTLYLMPSAEHSDSTQLAISVDGEEAAVAFAAGGNTDADDQGACTAVLHLTAGQRVWVGFNYGNPGIWASVLTSFSGVLIQSD